MFYWPNANQDDLKRFAIIYEMLYEHSKLLTFLFHKSKPELNHSPPTLIARSRAFSNGERILIRAALDIWSDTGDAKLIDLLSLDYETCKRVVVALLKRR